MEHPHPNHRLPVELLVTIFKAAATPIPYRAKSATNPGYFQRLHVLAQVCRLWAEVVKGSPELWWLIDGHDPPSEWTTALHRSQDYPIVFNYRRYGAQVPFDYHLWSSVAQHIRRWKTAYLAFDFARVQADSPGSLLLLENAAPALENLHMASSQSLTQQISLDLFDGYAPKLTTLNITDVTLRNWSSPILHGLTSLSVASVMHSGPSLEQMLDVLRASPRLHCFELHGVHFRDDAAKAESVVVLPKLTSISLISLSSVVTSRLLKGIKAPNCNATKVHVTQEEGLGSELYDSTTSWVTPTIKRSLAAGGKIEMNITTSRDASITIHQDDYDTSESDSYTYLNLPDTPTRPSILQWGLALIYSCESFHASLTVSLGIEDMRIGQVSDTLVMLQRLPNVISLALVGCEYDAVTSILKEMTSVSTSDAEGTPSWLCPDLRVLSFDDYIEEDVLVDLLTKRTQAASLRETAGGRNGVVRLHEITMYGEDTMNARVLRKLRSILGPGPNLRWLSDTGSDVECPDDEEENDDDDDDDDDGQSSGLNHNGSNYGDGTEGEDDDQTDEPAESSSSLASES